MINIDAKRLENANMEIWEILFFTFYSWKNAKFLVKIVCQIKNAKRLLENANMEIWEILFFTFYSWKNAKFLVKIKKKKVFAKYDKYRRKTSRKCKYGNLRNFIFHILLLKKRQILGKNSKKKSLPNMIKIDVKRPENANMEIWEILFFTFYSWKNAKFLVKIAKKKKKFAKYDKYRRKTSRKCKYGNLRNFIFHILLLKKRQILGKNSKKKKCLPNMINIDAKRPENANMEIWEILFFTFYSWKNAKFLVKIAKKKSLPNMIKIDVKRLENANMEIWEILFFTFYSWKNAKFLVKIAKKKVCQIW